MVKVDFLGLWLIIFCGPLDAALSREFSLSLDDGMPCVVIRIGFVVRAIVGNTPGDKVWIVTTDESAFGVSPIVLRLAQRSARSAISARYFFVVLSWSIVCINRKLEIPKMVYLHRFRMRLHIEILVVFLICETGKS